MRSYLKNRKKVHMQNDKKIKRECLEGHDYQEATFYSLTKHNIKKNYLCFNVPPLYCMAATISVNGVSMKQVSTNPVGSTTIGIVFRILAKAGTELSPLFRLLPPHLRQTVVESTLLNLSSSVSRTVTAVQPFYE
jgi:hypothetical protein